MDRKIIFLILAIVTALNILLAYRNFSPKTPIIEKNSMESACEFNFVAKFGQNISSYGQCVSEKLKKSNVLDKIVTAVDECMKMAGWNFGMLLFITGDGGQKYAIFPSPISQPCVLITFGIGNDIKAEKDFRAALPQCKLYGADPINASGWVYREVGKYFQFAVAAEAGILKASVYENGNYHAKNVTTVPLEEFLGQYVNQPLIDYLWMDNEAGEYEIFRKYFSKGRFMSICQVTVEFHKMYWDQLGITHAMFNEMIVSALSHSFMPIFTNGNQRIFFFNFADHYCLKKFIAPKFC